MWYGICEKCGIMGLTEKHHKFSNSKINRKLYGDLIDNIKNIQYLCYDCHHNKPVDKLSEIEFCRLLKIEPRSKTGKEIWKRIQQK